MPGIHPRHVAAVAAVLLLAGAAGASPEYEPTLPHMAGTLPEALALAGELDTLVLIDVWQHG